MTLKGNNAGLGGLTEDPISTQITAFFAHMPRMAFDFAGIPRDTILHKVKDQACYGSGTISSEYRQKLLNPLVRTQDILELHLMSEWCNWLSDLCFGG